MATIENYGTVPRRDFVAELRTMEDATLIAQQVCQQGAVHAIAYLMKAGVTEATATAMLDSLRVNMQLVREEAVRRGIANLFPEDQTGFS